MEIKKLLTNWRIILLIVAVLASIFALIPSGDDSVVVKSISFNSPLTGKLYEGDVLDWINNVEIETVDDVYQFDNFTGTLSFKRSGIIEIVELDKPGLGITVEKRDSGKIKLGMDLVGGSRVLLKPESGATEEQISDAANILQTRINLFGLKEAIFQVVKDDITGDQFIQIEMAGGSKKDVEDLLSSQGEFRAKVGRVVPTGSKFVGKTVDRVGDSVSLDGVVIAVNETRIVNGIPIELANVTNTSAALFGTVFTEDDIISVCKQEQPGICTSRLSQSPGGWEFTFQITITEEGANKFALGTGDMEDIGGQLDGVIVLLLDDEPIQTLSISSSLKGVAHKTPVISGGDPDKETAIHEKLEMQSILESGRIPIKLEIVKSDEISPTLGKEFVNSAVIAGIVAIFLVGVVVFIRYRKWKIVLPVVLTSFSEAIIILGLAATINWTIDLAAVAGIIATLGTGIDAMIAIIDELLLGQEAGAFTIKERVKRALFIIFGSASTIIAAMIPLMIIGIGAMKGFAITTILGVLIGVFIARPAFSKIAEHILGKQE